MIIGVPREIKDHEFRVALTPAGARELTKHGHQVIVESGAGAGIDLFDGDYESVGATILPNADEVWAASELIMKVKEPQPVEWPRIRPEHILFTYFHFASSEALTRAMAASGAGCVAYETVEDRNGTHPLLTPMSEVAGRLSIQAGTTYLEKIHGGKGLLMGGVPGVAPARVMIVGAGVVGTNAAKMAAGMGANVTMMDVNLERLRYLDDVMPANITTVFASDYNIEKELSRSDVIIGSVYLSGAKAPHVIRREHLNIMQRGTVMVDVAIDQGGCFESSRPTTHTNPIFQDNGILHYCVTNMPGAVARTSTFALTNATLPYARKLADKGLRGLIGDKGFMRGLNIYQGKVTHLAVARAFDLPTAHPEDLLQ